MSIAAPAMPAHRDKWELRLLEDPDLLRDITEAFVEEGQQLAQRLSEPGATHDLKQLRRTAHTLKTAFGTFGFESARQIAMEIERDCQNSQAAIAPDRIARLAELARQLTDECRGRLNSESSSGTMTSQFR